MYVPLQATQCTPGYKQVCTQVEDGYYETRCTSTRLQVETTPSPAQPQVQEVVTTTQVQDQGQVQPDTTGCQYR